MTPDPERLRRVMTPEWTPEREDTVWRALERDSPPPRWPWAVGAGLLAAAVAAVLLRPEPVVAPERVVPVSTPPVVSTAPAHHEPPPLSFRDGSRVFLDDRDSDVVVETVGPSLTETVLRRGGARFDVVPNPDRQFRVDAGLVSVEVLGTEFTVRRDDDEVHVAVLRGSVAVAWPGGRAVLEAGMEGDYPPFPSADPVEPGIAPEPATPPAPVRGRSKKPDAPTVDTLLDAADDARRHGDTAAALGILRRVVREHPRDARAPLAAFTMGRIEQGRGHHAVAAGHFAKVRTMRKNSLTEHALAREVESWAAAGKHGKAQARAEHYLRKYPAGPHATQVERVLEGAP